MSSLHPTTPYFSIAAAIGTILVLIPLPWHIEAMNTGTCYYMIWTALACLNQLVNSVVWAGNIENPAPVWCDVCEYSASCLGVFYLVLIGHKATRIIIGASVGIPASALCINIRLFKIARGRSALTTGAEVCVP